VSGEELDREIWERGWPDRVIVDTDVLERERNLREKRKEERRRKSRCRTGMGGALLTDVAQVGYTCKH
jgi:hypothetical protein